MTATDQTHRRCNALASRGPSTYGFRARRLRPRPGMTAIRHSGYGSMELWLYLFAKQLQ
jgi:hypothetical protein